MALLLVVMLEVVLNRLAVTVLRPAIGQPVPDWHAQLDRTALFLYYLTTVLAAGALAHQAWEFSRDRLHFSRAVRVLSSVGAAACALVLVGGLPQALPVALLEAALALVIATALIATLASPADFTAKLGLLAVTAPFFVHFAAFVALERMGPEAAQLSTLAERATEFSVGAAAVSALLVAICFAPPPLLRSLLRPVPVALAVFIATVASIVLRNHYEVGAKIASLGLGVELGAGLAPRVQLLYVAAAGGVVFTVASTFLADAPARRLLGVGFTLVVAGGMSFAWPLQYACIAVGMLAMAQGAARAPREEADATPAGARFHAPPIPAAAWDGYVASVAAALATTSSELAPSTGGSGGETRLVTTRRGLALRLALLRADDGTLRAVEILVGKLPAGAPPAATLWAQAGPGLATGAHPAPPRCAHARRLTGDTLFDQRFALQADAELARTLLDDGLRARAAAVLDGWLAIWPGTAVRYLVCPGRGAPLDHPVPATDLAFRGEAAPGAADRLIAVIDLVAEFAERAGVVPPAA